MTASLKLIRGLYDLGIRRSIATPHIIGDLYRNTPQTISAALNATRIACKDAGIDMELSAGAEYMLDDHFMALLVKNEPLLTIHGQYILTELSYNMLPANLQEIVFTIITSGYKPILAHPERYHYFHFNFQEYRRLIDLGFHLQVNLLSLTGYYGKTVEKAARYIMRKGWADLVGTDLHHEKHLAALRKPQNLAIFSQVLEGRRMNLFE